MQLFMSKRFKRVASHGFLASSLWTAMVMGLSPRAWAQGPAPETGNTIFPGGAFVSYGATFTSMKMRLPLTNGTIPPTAFPTSTVAQELTFSWGVRRDLQVTATVPVMSNRLDASGLPAGPRPGGTSLGDTLLLLKYRFLRLDSERGTSQASITLGPSLPTGRTNLREGTGTLLPARLQPGSGSTDFLVNFSGTYTGLFNVEKLVADETITYLKRGQDARQTGLGDVVDSRFYLSYRPYQTHSLDREWWIGPVVDWRHVGDETIAGVRQPQSSASILGVGASTFFSPSPGIIFWLGLDFPVAQEVNGGRMEKKRRIGFGVTKQFKIHG